MIFKRLKKGSITRLALRYLAEVVIIFVGITASFLFEQWREERKQQKALVELAESLVADLVELKAILKNDLKGSVQWISQLDSLRAQRIINEPSEKQLIWFFEMLTGQNIFQFDPYSPTYISAVGNGSIYELPENIRNQLYKLYRKQLPQFQLLYDQQHENVASLKNSIITSSDFYLYTSDLSQIEPNLQLLAKEIQKPMHGNFVNQIILTEKTVYQVNEKAFAAILKLERDLQEYVRAHKNQ